MKVWNEILSFFIGFNLNLSLFSAAFLCRFKLRKNRWWILLVGGLLFLFGPLAYKLIVGHSIYSAPFLNIGWYSTSYLILCAIFFVICYFSFEISAKELLLIICCSYLFQNTIHNLHFTILRSFPGINADVLKVLSVLLNFALSTAIYFLFKNRIIRFDIGKVKTTVVLIFSVSLIFLLTVVSQWTGAPSDDGTIDSIAVALYGGIVSVLLLCILLGIFNTSWVLHENAAINGLLKNAERQYRVSRDNVEYINSKVHDMKHRIAALKQLLEQGDRTPDMEGKIAELEKVVEVYDDTVLTGNNVLDTLITEEKSLCKKNQIKLEYLVDGSILNFIDPVDLYVLFGNALDNAIESVLKIEDVEKRVISIVAEKRGKLVHIAVENFYTGDLVLHNGLPRTSKADEQGHGYGVKSIKFIAQKYGGNITISAENSRFSLSILIPSNKPEKTEENNKQ